MLFKQFAMDLDDLPPLETPSVGALPNGLRPGLQELRNVAGGKLLDLSDALSECAALASPAAHRCARRRRSREPSLPPSPLLPTSGRCGFL